MEKLSGLRAQFLLILMRTGLDGGIRKWESGANFNLTSLQCFPKEIFPIRFSILRKLNSILTLRISNFSGFHIINHHAIFINLLFSGEIQTQFTEL